MNYCVTPISPICEGQSLSSIGSKNQFLLAKSNPNKIIIKYMHTYKYVGPCTRAAEGFDLDQVLIRLRDNSS